MVVALAATGPGPGAAGDLSVGQRIASSYAAAQALQGELDGIWDLRDLAGRQIYSFAIVDPPGGLRIEAVWQTPRPVSGDQASGTAQIALTRDLRLTFSDLDGPVDVRLHRSANRAWTGRLVEGGRSRRVVLRRRGDP
jgi:hypothetical protein